LPFAVIHVTGTGDRATAGIAFRRGDVARAAIRPLLKLPVGRRAA
jgi:hypothetical protein